MPLPTPASGESHADFMSRCLGSETMKSDFPNHDQRVAVCMAQAKKRSDEMEMEVRFVSGLEIRQTGTARPRLAGYAAVFDKRSLNLGGFVEVIRRGAFVRSLKENPDVRAFVEHNPANIIGRRSAGTLDLSEDAQGLRVEITPPDTQAGRDVVENVRAGNLDGMSFAFGIPDLKKGQAWNFEEDPALRELLDVDLREVSVVALPAYPDTAVALRSMAVFQADRPYRPSLAMRDRIAKLPR